MPVSPQDYALWASATGNPYPRTAQEKARLAPEVYDFNRGFGKVRGFDEVQGFQGDVVYDQPISVRQYGDNSLLQAPVTPDNNIPKVAGQLNNTLTGQHYTQHYADNAVDVDMSGQERPKTLLEKAALGALGVGALAAGVYGAQKVTGRDLGVGRVGGMLQNLGQRAKSGIKSALGLSEEAAEPSFVVRNPTEGAAAVATHGTSAVDDVAPGLVRGQHVVPAEVRVQQSLKSRVPDPWYESALATGEQMVSSPAMQSVVGTQTSGAGLDPDITARIEKFRNENVSLFSVNPEDPYFQQKFVGPVKPTPVPSQATAQLGELVRSSGGSRSTVLSGIDPKTKQPFSVTVPRSELLASKGEQLFDPKGVFVGYGTKPIIAVPGKAGTVALASPVPQPPSVLGSFPGTEGSSASGVQFTALQGASEGRPYRYSVLPAGEPNVGESVAEFLQRVDTPEGLGGLLAPQRPLREGSLSGAQRAFSTDPRAATVQKQAEAIFQATGDPSVIRAAYSESPGLPIRVTLPSGESVPTGSLYEAFGIVQQPVIDKITGTKTYSGPPMTEVRAESLQSALNMQSKMKARALEQLGLPSTYQPSQAELQRLDPSTKKLLGQAAAAVEANRAALAQAEANPLLYKLRPEVTEGIREVPVISETTGEVVGSRVVPEVEGMPTSEFYKMRAAGGAGRQEVGGVGRRREALAAEGFAAPQGSTLEATPYLYRNVDTGEVLTEGQVKREDVLSGAARPIRGTAVEPQRIMGSEGRTFKGVSQDVIDPRSFDPAALAAIAEATPERIDPSTGLAYSTAAMGGEKIAQERRQMEAMRQSGARVRGRMGTELPASVVRGRGVSVSGVDPALGTRFARQGPAPEGSARAQAGELVRQRMELVQKALRGEL